MLKVKGEDVMDAFEIPPGPRVGWILGALLEEVLEDPEKNERMHLMNRVKALGSLSDDALSSCAKSARPGKMAAKGRRIRKQKENITYEFSVIREASAVFRCRMARP